MMKKWAEETGFPFGCLDCCIDNERKDSPGSDSADSCNVRKHERRVGGIRTETVMI